MKKTITHVVRLTAMLLVILFTIKANAQTGCHTLFGFHQAANTLTINFTDSSTSPHTITSWLWDFGDGNTSTSQNPSHTYAHNGTYYVCLTIHDNHGCSSTYCHHVTVNPVATSTCHAAFTFHQTENTLTINFTDGSTSPYTITSWQWDFGNGNTSTSQNPSHTYVHNGTYYVCLTIQDAHGCSSTYCHHVTAKHHQHALVANSIWRTQSGKDITLCDPQYIINYPNPSNASTTIQYELTSDANVKIEIYDVTGNRITQVINEKESAGEHAQLANTSNLNSGFYFIKMSVGKESFIKKIAVIR